MTSGRPVEQMLMLIEQHQRGWGSRQVKICAAMLLIVAFYVACWRLAQVDVLRLVSGLPRLARWLAEAWPPKLDAV